MKTLITLLFWGTITVYCFGHFIMWAVPILASPFVALFAIVAIMAGVGRSTSR